MMSLRVVMVLVHMLLFFTRMHFGVEFWFLRRGGRRHGYEWFGYVQRMLGLGVNACVSRACSVVRPRQISISVRDRSRFRQRRVGCAKGDRVVLAGYEPLYSSLRQERQRQPSRDLAIMQDIYATRTTPN